MARRHNIFEKHGDLRPSAMATVAERRFDDAEALKNTHQNARANGVAYLVGFVIEILLKARLVSKFPETAKKRQHQVADGERDLWRLIWREHDLEGMLSWLPELEAAMQKQGEEDGQRYFDNLKYICATWTIQARYSSYTINMGEAADLLERVQALKELLK